MALSWALEPSVKFRLRCPDSTTASPQLVASVARPARNAANARVQSAGQSSPPATSGLGGELAATPAVIVTIIGMAAPVVTVFRGLVYPFIGSRRSMAPSLDDGDHSGEGGDHARDDGIYAGNENPIGDPRILLLGRFSFVREPRLGEVARREWANADDVANF